MLETDLPDDCELFRPLAAVSLADPRYKHFAVFEGASRKWRPTCIGDHHAGVDALELGARVPKDVRIAFDTARNVLLYAWFVYRFHQVAELQALAAVELSLRRRMGLNNEGRSPTLGKLLDRALAKKLIRGDGFRQYHRIVAGETRFYELMEEMPGVGSVSTPSSPPPDTYAKIVIKFLKNQRNHLAHGSEMLYPHGAFTTMAACCDLINQLFACSPDQAPQG